MPETRTLVLAVLFTLQRGKRAYGLRRSQLHVATKNPKPATNAAQAEILAKQKSVTFFLVTSGGLPSTAPRNILIGLPWATERARYVDLRKSGVAGEHPAILQNQSINESKCPFRMAAQKFSTDWRKNINEKALINQNAL
jgi:hypothetical protein